MKKNTLYDLGRILLIVVAVLLTVTLVLFIISGVFVGKIEDTVYAMSYGEYDFNLSGRDIKTVISLAKESFKSEFGYKPSVSDIITEISGYEVSGVGFAMFCLYGRSWFLFFTIVTYIAATVLMMIGKQSEMGSLTAEYLEYNCKAFVKAYKGLFVFNKKPRAPRAPSAPRAPRAAGPVYKCPNCGAPVNAGSPFCAQCGARMPDMSTVGVCKACGTRNDPRSNFCAGCGAPMR